MPFVPVPSTCLAEIRMTADSQQVENTLWFDMGASPTAVNMTALGEALRDWWIAFPAELMWQGVVLREIVLTSMHSATGPQVTVPGISGQNGQLASPPLPTSVSLTVSFRTGSRGRSFRGRNYIVGLIEDQTSGPNTIDSGVIASWVEAYQQILTVASGQSVDWVVASRFSGVDANGKPIPRTTGIASPITSVVIVDPIVDSQRRRLPGRGN